MRARGLWAGLLATAVATTAVVASPVGASEGAAHPSRAPADAVVEWSEVAERAFTTGRPPGSAEVLMGMVHAAIYDAVIAIEGGYQPYAVSPTVPGRASVEAAVATAAHGVVVARAPEQAAVVGERYVATLEALPRNRATLNGIAVGVQVADAIVAARAGDGFANAVAYQQPTPGPGVFEPVAPTPPVDVRLGRVTPLALSSADQFRPDAPYPLASAEYAADLAEVAALGRADSAVRSAEQTETAHFWAEHTAVQWSRALRHLAVAQHLDARDTARLLAMTHVAAADAMIGCFEAKYHYLFWRPIHAIPRADTDGNAQTEADSTWTALLTVNHPEYPSGHACFTAAVTHTLTSFFGTDDVAFSMDSTVTKTTHDYERFSEALDEVVDARVWSGLHYRTSMDKGSELGRNVADLVSSTLFAPIA